MVHNFPSNLPGFYVGLYEVVDDPSLDSVISWTKSNKSFIIWNPEKLLHISLYPKFLCSTFSRFLNCLDMHGFKRNKKSKYLEFGHKEFFVRDKPELLKKLHGQMAMRRMKNRSKAAKAKKEVEERLQNLRI